jgi:hypothetical protein
MGAGDFAPQTVRHAFYVREKEACFLCRRPLRWEERGMGWSAHHRKPRGMGGTSDPRVASIANCLIVCGSGTTGCHGRIERNREVALAVGLLIPKNATTESFAPAAVRVRRMDRSWWLLTESGRAVEVDEGMPQ